jgi:hypothetical protein
MLPGGVAGHLPLETLHVFLDYLSVDCYLALDEIANLAMHYHVKLKYHPYKAKKNCEYGICDRDTGDDMAYVQAG